MIESENKLNYYRSELKAKNVASYKLIGIASEIILSFDMFPKNDDLTDLIKDVYEVSFKPYVLKSRTLIVARIVRMIYNADENEFENYRKNLLKFITSKLDENEKNLVAKKKGSGFEKWMDGISNVRKKDN